MNRPTFASVLKSSPKFLLLALNVLVDQSVSPLQLELRPIHHAFDQYLRLLVELTHLLSQSRAILSSHTYLLAFAFLLFILDGLQSAWVGEELLKFALEVLNFALFLLVDVKLNCDLSEGIFTL
jgi:hypothetical protein